MEMIYIERLGTAGRKPPGVTVKQVTKSRIIQLGMGK